MAPGSISSLPRKRAVSAQVRAAQVPLADGRVSHKGQQTKAAIVGAALQLAAQVGLQGLSIGALAEAIQMSKSGVFAHFGSREELQISVIREYFNQFEQEVFHPALKLPRGLPRVEALFANWMKRVAVEIQSGCIFISGASRSNRPSGEWAITAWGMPCSRILRVSARVSTPARPTTPRRAIQDGRSESARQLAGGVGTSRKIAPRAAVCAEPDICSRSSAVVPVLPMWGKVKATIWAM